MAQYSIRQIVKETDLVIMLYFLIISVSKAVLPKNSICRMTTKVAKKNLNKPPMDKKHRRELIASYREDIANLQGLIGHDLSR